jgi:hypothetical protein
MRYSSTNNKIASDPRMTRQEELPLIKSVLITVAGVLAILAMILGFKDLFDNIVDSLFTMGLAGWC